MYVASIIDDVKSSEVLGSCSDDYDVKINTGRKICEEIQVLRRSLVNGKKTHCPKGHEYTPENTCINSLNQRHCRTCQRLFGRKRWLKIKDNENFKRRLRFHDNPTKRKGSNRQYWLKKKYGITENEYQNMIIRQGGTCAICKNPQKEGMPFNIDHDHNSGKVRGLLCFSCNVSIGHFRENPDIILSAIKYLQSHVRL